MKFIDYNFKFTSYTLWGCGLLVKDALTLTFKDDNTGVVSTVDAVINYSARGYGRLVIEPHKQRNARMLYKHIQYIKKTVNYRINIVYPALYNLIGKEFKSVNSFIKEYNNRAYVYYG